MINIVDIPEPRTIADPFEFGLLLPIPSTETNSILMEDRDGSQVQRLTATAVQFNAAGRTAFRDRKVKIDLFITDARFALACSKYDKGGGWSFWGGGGALALDVVFNSVSKARAKLRTRGKMLVGQVRYPWLQRVGSVPKTGWASDEKLILESSAGKGGGMRLTLTLPKSIDASRVAAEITRRAASYRLASEDLDADVRSWLTRLVTVEPDDATAADSNGFRFFQLPAANRVSEESARFLPDNARSIA